MPGIKFTTYNWKKEISESDVIPRKIKVSTARDVKTVSLITMRRVKRATPIDTGRARASWGADIWEESDNGMTIEQGSEVEYFSVLNEGHSKQAPAGFVEIAMHQALDEFEKMLLDSIEDASK